MSSSEDHLTGDVTTDRIALEVLGTTDDSKVLSRISALCAQQFGSPPLHRVFHKTSVGSVHALHLDDGRQVVVKLHRSIVPMPYLQTLSELQQHVTSAGFPAPRPLAPPLNLGTGRVTFEEFLVVGEPPDPYQAAHRDEMACSLAQLVALCRPFAGREELRPWLPPRRGDLWPVPHDPRFDFSATAEGAEWIDALGRQALSVQQGTGGALVVGHHDWRREHLRLRSGRLCAVYDWDSVGRFPEPVLVAGAVRTYTADWSLSGHRQYPTLEEMEEFLVSYETARGAPFSRRERAQLWAAVVYGAAYTARCEHSDDRTDFGSGPLVPASTHLPETSMRAFLAANGPLLLARSSRSQ